MKQTFQYYEQAFRTLHTNMQRGKPAPHKAFMLLTVIDMIEEELSSFRAENQSVSPRYQSDPQD